MTATLVRLIAAVVFAGMLGWIGYWTVMALRWQPGDLPKRVPGRAKAAMDLADLEIEFARMDPAAFDRAVRDLVRSLPH